MSSAYVVYPPGPDTTTARRDRLEQPRSHPAHDISQHQNQHQQAQRDHLSPFSHPLGSNTASPAFSANTPAESVSTLSVHYQSSEFSELDDPFFGVDFNAVEGASPSFLDDDILQFNSAGQLANDANVRAVPPDAQHVYQTTSYLPLSPDKSPSLPGGSPNGLGREDAAARGVFPDLSRTSVAPHELSLKHEASSPEQSARPTGFQLTPKTSGSVDSSDDGLATTPAMQSPRVTVSHWDRDNAGGAHEPNTGPLGHGGTGFGAVRDGAGRWIPNRITGQSGWEPSTRSAIQVESINGLAAQRKLDERNQEVDGWLESTSPLSHAGAQAEGQPTDMPSDGPDNVPLREISMGDKTENTPVPGQIYYVETGGELTREDLEIMRQARNWDNAPVPFAISRPDYTAYQPQTSQAAIEKYERMCHDNASIVSRAATWGTRRLSLPSIIDSEVQVAGNLLKKLSLSRGDTRRPSILEGLRGLVRRPSVNSSKRTRAEPDDASSSPTDSLSDRKESPAKLAPPSSKPGWPRKQSVPSINTAFIDVGSSLASIGATHARSGSISATPITSPRSPSGLGLSVKRPLSRFRSKSESTGIVDLWKKSGGPPVSNLGNAKVNAPEVDDDEDDDDDMYEDGDLGTDSDKLIDDIAPNFAGFQQHLLKLNPLLATANNYLVDRIAHHQGLRYKGLLNLRVKHMQAIAARNCSCGTMCIALGGSANMLDPKGDTRSLDPLSARYDGSDGDVTPLEGAINQDSFPQDIPMPPTGSLPAEFECQLCFAAKKFHKPSDWTKHVHEDVQPFTCTWYPCKDAKMFKRKADWVRHENEGHRHLEWWACDVDECTHICYRRDNFLQHLVREHKFVEPKVKTKAAMKRAGGVDPTWAKVERCHQQTAVLPQQEPCRFCGKVFPSWKKLTVHLAKHMEQISLPVLKLVAKKELDEDTIISPVQEPPPRSFPATVYPIKQEPHPFGPSPTIPHGPMPRQPGPMAYPNPPPPPLGMYALGPTPTSPFPAGLYAGPDFDDLAHHPLAQAQINNMQPPSPMAHPHSYHQPLNPTPVTTAFPPLPVTSAPPAAYMPAPLPQAHGGGGGGYMSMAPDLEPFPALSMNALGLGLGVQDPTAAGPAQMGGYHSSGGGGGGVVGVDHHLQQQHQHQHHQQHGHGQRQQHQQFTPQGSVSPYAHSPNVPHGGFYRSS